MAPMSAPPRAASERTSERGRTQLAAWCSGSRTDAVAAGPPRRAAAACYRAPRPPHRLLPGGRCHRRHPPAPRQLGKWEAPGRIGGRLPARQPLATGKRNGRRVPGQPSPRGRHWRSSGRVQAKRRDWVPLSRLCPTTRPARPGPAQYVMMDRQVAPPSRRDSEHQSEDGPSSRTWPVDAREKQVHLFLAGALVAIPRDWSFWVGRYDLRWSRLHWLGKQINKQKNPTSISAVKTI